MQEGLIFAAITAVTFGLWTVFHQQASKYINGLLGAILVSFIATVVGLVVLLLNRSVNLFATPRGLLFIILTGLCAFALDYFALKAYGSGLSVSVAGPIIIGGSVAVASVIGFSLGDIITVPKIISIILVAIGSGALAALGT